MSPASYVLALVIAAGSVASPHGGIGDRGAPVECLRFTQPLGYSASGALEQGDSKWYVLELDESGIVSRPLFPTREREQWTRLSRWTTRGDTVLIRVSDGLVGWDISLRGRSDGFLGAATYRTDVRVKGWVAPRRGVRASTTRCPAPSH